MNMKVCFYISFHLFRVTIFQEFVNIIDTKKETGPEPGLTALSELQIDPTALSNSSMCLFLALPCSLPVH